jgi:hypothetical protein
VKCINCKHIDLKRYPKHSNNGMAPCKLLKDLGVFMTLNFERNCERYEKASEAILIKRQAWAEQIEMFR